MNLIPLLLFMFAAKGGGSSAPRWPGQRHPPPGKLARHGRHNPPNPPSPAPLDATAHATPLHDVPAPASKEILVADAQRIAIARGEALKPDGLFGPKTAAAWARVATAKGLDPTFARLGPRSASVDAATYKTLASGAMDPKSMAKAQAKRLLSSFGGKLLSGADGAVYIP